MGGMGWCSEIHVGAGGRTLKYRGSCSETHVGAGGGALKYTWGQGVVL